MKTVSLKIDDIIFGETEEILSIVQKPRNRYINEALTYYNRMNKREIIKRELARESDLVKDNSISVLKEFEGIEYDGSSI
ncbi:conserved hypothetical protein [Desulfamplus magnetovallimortis]|uniref:Uncharacterized protein n=1 Tax=Desulfamplus magnetovallimortis TaxID=1246637 RepID=A0A1W1HFE8_9BACT|nr:hypothetical protein [Desulfamplus magnetovallimortis]SLM31190.1 conserved hypothetical protein [Desulfamplus magnetovallimortis]